MTKASPTPPSQPEAEKQREPERQPGDSSPRRANAKEVLGDAAERWLARNRSLVLRQTPVWAQSLAAIVIGLGTVAVVGGVLFRIDEVVTVTGQLESITGSTDVKTPAGGKVAQVLFKDGQLVGKGQRLVRFDTRQAADEKATLTRLIDLENRDLQSKLMILRDRQKVLQQKVSTSEEITGELKGLVSNGGFQRVQYLQQLDQLYELKSQLASVQLEMNRTSLETQKSIGQMRNRLRQAELQLQYQNVVAPVAGVVFEPKAGWMGCCRRGKRSSRWCRSRASRRRCSCPTKTSAS